MRTWPPRWLSSAATSRWKRLARPVLATTGNPEVAGQLAWALAFALARRGLDDQLLAVTSGALTERTLPPVWTARIRGLLAQALAQVGRFQEAAETAAQARAEGERAGDRYSIGFALSALIVVEVFHHRNLTAGLALANEALAALGDDPDTDQLRMTLLGNRSGLLDNHGRPAEADRGVAEALVLAERIGNPARVTGARARAAEMYFLRGRWDDALVELDAANDALLAVDRRLILRGIATLIAVCRDDRATTARQLRDVEDLTLTTDRARYMTEPLRIAWALAAERDGKPALALARLLKVFDPDSSLRFAELTADNSPLWLPDVVRLAMAAGDAAVAGAATKACETAAQQQRLPFVDACAQHCRGLLSADATLLRAAADTFADIGYPLFSAQALENTAVILAERGNTRAARSAYGDAIHILTELGAAWQLMRADGRLRPLGIRQGVRGARRRPTSGWEALTPTETKIAQLVATGQSNPDIAAALFLSRRTIQTHVSHILTKLGARSRVEIARQAPPSP